MPSASPSSPPDSPTRSIAEHQAAVAALLTSATQQVAVARLSWPMVLASDLTARLPVPSFDNAAVDGFAVRSADLAAPGPWTLPVVADVLPGHPAQPIPAGAAIRVMAGAAIADAENTTVVRLTTTDAASTPDPPKLVTITAAPENPHIRRRGEHLRPGEVAVPAGTPIDGGTIAAALTVGATHAQVFRLPSVAVLTTGDELVAAGHHLGPGQVPDSNGPMLVQLCRGLGVTATLHHVGDDPRQLRATLNRLIDVADVIITTGGASAGAFDVVRTGVTGSAWFGEVNMTPGRPQGVGLWAGVPIICLPGDPVAAWVSFQIFVAPAIHAQIGTPHRRHRMRLVGPVRPATHLSLAVPCRIDWARGTATPTSPVPGGHRVAAIAGATGVAIVPQRWNRLAPVEVLSC